MLSKLICVLALVTYVSGHRHYIYGLTPLSPDYAELKAELISNRALWKTRVGSAYKMVIERRCLCPIETRGPFEVVVMDGKILSVKPENQYSDPPTVEEVFDEIEKAIDARASSVTVAYDKKLGYPTHVFIDKYADMADEEIGFEVRVSLLWDAPKTCKVDLVRPNFSASRGNAPFNGFRAAVHFSNFLKWKHYRPNIDCTYTYKFTRNCFCPLTFRGPFLITVENGEIVKAEYEEAENGDVTEEVLKDLPTITDLFQLIYDEALSADEADVEYDHRSGVPTRAFFDRIKLAVDDEIAYLAELVP